MGRNITDILNDLKESNADDYNLLSSHITGLNEESKGRKTALKTNEQLVQEVLTAIGKKDLKEIPNALESKNIEISAVMKKLEEMKSEFDVIKSDNELKDKKLQKGERVDTLTEKFKSAGFDNPKYHADLYADRLTKGETGDMIGTKFVDDYIKDLGESMPSFLSKKAPDTITDTGELKPKKPSQKFDISPEGMKAMPDDFFIKNQVEINNQIAEANKANGDNNE